VAVLIFDSPVVKAENSKSYKGVLFTIAHLSELLSRKRLLIVCR